MMEAVKEELESEQLEELTSVPKSDGKNTKYQPQKKRKPGNPNGWSHLSRDNSIKARRIIAKRDSAKAVEFIRWLKKEHKDISVREITRRLNISNYTTTRGKTFLPGSTQNLFKYL